LPSKYYKRTAMIPRVN